MLSVLAVMTVSSQGNLRLNKALCVRWGIQRGDKVVVLKGDDTVTIQVQRGDAVILQLRDATLVRCGEAT